MNYYDKQGKPIDLLEWVKLFEDASYQVVKQTTIGKYLISSVWLGTTWLGVNQGKPQIFETMIFVRDSSETERKWVFSTEQDILKHHDELVAEYTSKVGNSCRCQRLLVGHDADCLFQSKK